MGGPFKSSIGSICILWLWFVAIFGIADMAIAADRPIRIATPIYPSQVGNPYLALGLPAILPTIAVIEPLAVVDKNGQVQPWLATSWTSADSKTWRITLRQGVQFSNGAAFGADALVASFAHMQSAQGRTETISNAMAVIDGVEAVSDYEVIVRLKEFDAMFPYRLARWRVPEPETWAAVMPDPERIPLTVAGTGPYRIDQVSATQIVFVANERAWNPPQASGLVLQLIPDQLARFQALTSGAVDLAIAIGVGDKPEVEAKGGVMHGRLTALVPYVGAALIQNPDSPVQDPRVRQAMNYAVNKDAIASIILDGATRPIGQLARPGAPGYMQDLAPYPHDPAQAKALLEEAGFPNGIDITIRTSVPGPDDLSVYQQIANDLRAVNIRVNLQQIPLHMMTRMLFTGDFEGADLFSMSARGLDTPSDYRVRACLGLTSALKAFYCDPGNLDNFAKARAATTLGEASRHMEAAIRREYENPPGIFLWPGIALDGSGPKLSGLETYADHYDFIPLHRLQLKD